MRDEKTVAYFDQGVHEYSTGRLRHAMEFLSREGRPEHALLDVGCGVGNLLEYLKQNTKIGSFCGADVSPACVAKTRERFPGCDGVVGSIVDDAFVSEMQGRRFDFVLLVAVLHHLIGPSRAASRELAERALENSLALLKPSGHLLVVEPVFYPPLAMDAVFHLKRLVTRFTEGRVGVLGYWNNIGAPVVSYYNREEVRGMLQRAPAARIVRDEFYDEKLRWVVRLAGVTRRGNATFILVREGGKLTGV